MQILGFNAEEQDVIFRILASGKVCFLFRGEEEEGSIYMYFVFRSRHFIFSIQADESCQKINLAVI